MSRILLTSLATLLLASTAIAAAPQSADAGGKLTARDARAQCRAEAKTQGLKGDERKASVSACFAKAMPEQAAAMKCRMDGKAKGLSGGDLRKFTRQCRAGSATA